MVPKDDAHILAETGTRFVALLHLIPLPQAEPSTLQANAALVAHSMAKPKHLEYHAAPQ